MVERIKQITAAQWLFLVGLAMVLLIIYNVVLALTRIGEIKVSISVVPKDAKVTINDKVFSKRTVYLAPGDYAVSASADGWTADNQKINISRNNNKVYLLPDPASEAIKKWLNDNPDIQLKRETISGEKLSLQNQKALGRNPILGQLPFSQESPPFTIDYGPSNERKGDIFLIISDSSPNGRQAALNWIRQQGEDPTNLEIIFSGFVNPLDATAGAH